MMEKSQGPVEKKCDSPCTISRNENNDLITLSDVQNKNQILNLENERLSKELDNLEKSLKKCENPASKVSKRESETIIKELQS